MISLLEALLPNLPLSLYTWGKFYKLFRDLLHNSEREGKGWRTSERCQKQLVHTLSPANRSLDILYCHFLRICILKSQLLSSFLRFPGQLTGKVTADGLFPLKSNSEGLSFSDSSNQTADKTVNSDENQNPTSTTNTSCNSDKTAGLPHLGTEYCVLLFCCCICGFESTNKENLLDHMKEHEGEIINIILNKDHTATQSVR